MKKGKLICVLIFLATATLAVLKATGVMSMCWAWVISPIWIPSLIACIAQIAVLWLANHGIIRINGITLF